MKDIGTIKLGANPARPRPNATPNWCNISINNISQKAIVVYEVDTHPGKVKNVTGRQGQTLCCLVKAGNAGITAAEVSSWALRLASYVFKLRLEHGINITTCNEPNAGGIGTHARYILSSQIKIIEIRDTEGGQ